jgi:hypothetical protein
MKVNRIGEQQNELSFIDKSNYLENPQSYLKR